MSILIKNGEVMIKDTFIPLDIFIDEEGTLVLADTIDCESDEELDASGLKIIPGLIDPHVHLRQPGYEYKETIETGTLSGAKGGYTTLFAMPNLNPIPNSVQNIQVQLDLIKQNALVHVIPYASITMNQSGSGELVDFKALSEYTFAFSDDGKGMQSEEEMREAMKAVKAIDGMIVAHCEDESLLVPGGCIHEGKYAKEHQLLGISSESEYKQIERDLKLVRETCCQYHVCHISCKESIELIKQAKKEGYPVSCEVTPHHLLLSEEDLQDDGKFKMNPPLRSLEDKEALVSAFLNGDIDMIGTDHAPHSEDEKSRGLKGSVMGVVGLETAFPLLYTHFVKTKRCSLAFLVKAMSLNVADIFRIEGGYLENFIKANLTILDLQKSEVINPAKFLSLGRSTPFEGQRCDGWPVYTIVDGKVVYRRK